MTPNEGARGEPLEIIERAYAALDADDVPAFLALCSNSVVVRYPAAGLLAYGGDWQGLDGVSDFLDAHDATEEIVMFERKELVAAADLVLAFGDFSGLSKATGRSWGTDFVHAFRVTDGRIDRWQAFFDTSAAVEAHRL
jgi:ketosteroid isomerase-like protein